MFKIEYWAQYRYVKSFAIVEDMRRFTDFLDSRNVRWNRLK
jgi:hypothetical protein